MIKKFLLLYLLFANLFIACTSDDEAGQTETAVDYNQLTERTIEYFLDFVKTPRPGFHLDKARDYLKDFADVRGWKWTRDEYGNCWIDVPATKGYESYPKLILQGHMDMICDVAYGETMDVNTEVGTPHREGDKIWGDHMNLGADNGIGVAIALAIADSDLGHGPLRCLFTADEDCGMFGAEKLDPKALDSDYLISLDAELEGVVYIGCLGSVSNRFTSQLPRASSVDGLTKVKVNISGLKGGHSGWNINDHRLNACDMIRAMLVRLSAAHEVSLVGIDAGSADNAIANAAEMTLAVREDEAETVKEKIIAIINEYASEYAEETILSDVVKEDVDASDYVCAPEATAQVLSVLVELIYGPIEIDQTGYVTKSSNIAPMTLKDGAFYMLNMMRAISNEWLEEQKNIYSTLAQQHAMAYAVDSYSPAWTNVKGNPLVNMLKGYYEEALGQPIEEIRTRGCVEPAFFCLYHPGLQTTCIGPTITEAHTINETLYLNTLRPVMQTVVNTMQHINMVAR